MNTEKKQLWRVIIFIKPTPNHPQFHKMSWGIFHIWLTDDSDERARGRALAIARQLPFIIDRRTPKILAVCDPAGVLPEGDEDLPEWSITKRIEGMEFGFDHYLEMWPVGSPDPLGADFSPAPARG